MSRIRVDLPEPLAPRIPWMSPRSRRIDTSEIAATGFFFRPTTNALLTPSMTGARERPCPPAGGRRGHAVGQGVVFSWLVTVAVTSDAPVWWRWRWTRNEPRASSDASSVGLAARDGPGLPVRAGKGIKKAGGPIWPTARGSRFGGLTASG